MREGIDCIGVSVGVLILNRKGEVFLSKRSSKTRNEHGSWEAPGGAVEFGEKRVDALKREIKEELGIEINIKKTLQTSDEILTKYKQHWVPTSYIATVKGGKQPRIMEPEKCDAIGWFPLDRLPRPLSYITSMDIKEYKRQRKAK